MTSAKVPGENVTDLEEIVKRWSGEVYDITKTKDQARISREHLQFNINWKQVKFHFDEPKYDIVPALFNGPPSHPNQSSSHHSSSAGTPVKLDRNHLVQPRILFKTYFANTTGHEQEYSFKTERCTRSTCTVCVETGFSRGYDFGLKLTVPGEVAEANAGFKREITVNNIGEDTIEEELMWGVDSTVRVPAKTEATAELVVQEAQCQAAFMMETKFHGKVLVTVTNLKENNSLVTVLEGNIADIMQREIQKGMKGFKVQGKVVLAETRGKCNFKYGIEQRVRISERAITTNLDGYFGDKEAIAGGGYTSYQQQQQQKQTYSHTASNSAYNTSNQSANSPPHNPPPPQLANSSGLYPMANGDQQQPTRYVSTSINRAF